MSWCTVFALFAALWLSIILHSPPLNAADMKETEARIAELQRQERYSEAIELATQHIQKLRNLLGPDNPEVGYMLNRLAELNRLNGQTTQAVEIYHNVLINFFDLKGEHRSVIRTALGNLSLLYMSIGKFDSAEKYAALMRGEAKMESKPVNSERASDNLRPETNVTQSQKTTTSIAAQAFQPQQLAGVATDNWRPSNRAAPRDKTPDAINAEQRRPNSVQRASCPQPLVTAKFARGGVLDIDIVSTCLAEQTYEIVYGKHRFEYQLSSLGTDKRQLDPFTGLQNRISVEFPGQKPIIISVPQEALNNVVKVALVWNKAVDLDLHVFEYAAKVGQKGHIWSGANRTLNEATALVATSKRAHGYLSHRSSGQSSGTNYEVYTLLRHPEQRFGAVSFMLDFKSRGSEAKPPFCGPNELGTVDFEIYRLQSNGTVQTSAGLIPSMPCGQSVDEENRYLFSLIPAINLRRR